MRTREEVVLRFFELSNKRIMLTDNLIKAKLRERPIQSEIAFYKEEVCIVCDEIKTLNWVLDGKRSFWQRLFEY